MFIRSSTSCSQAVLPIFGSQDYFTNAKVGKYLGYKLYALYHDPSSSIYPDILFTMSPIGKMPKAEKGHNSVKYSQNFTNS